MNEEESSRARVEPAREVDVAANNEAEEESTSRGAEDASNHVEEEEARRMQLTDQEREWALNVKRAIEEDPELDSISDFACAQLALVDGADLESALERARRLQAFRQQYDIRDSLRQGEVFLRNSCNLLPGFYLSLGFTRVEENTACTLVVDLSKMCATTLASNLQEGFPAAYYMYQALCYDLAHVRLGSVVILECEGFDWKKSFGPRYFQQYWTELGAVYPIRYYQVKHYHTGMVLNLLVSMGRKFLPADLKDRFEVGCTSPMGRLDAFYFVPNREMAMTRFLARFTHSLRQRYENEASFSLE